MKKYISMIIPVFFLTGCTTLSKDVILVTESSEAATVVIYRESAFQAGAVSLLVGKDNKYFAALRNNSYTSFQIDPGTHILQAKADGAPASSIEITPAKNETICLAGKPNPKMLGAAVPAVSE